MSLHVALNHRTTYRYDRPINLGPHIVRLRPAPHCRTPILSYSLKVLPETQFLNWQQDPQGNFLARLVFPEPATFLEVTVDLVAEMVVVNPFDFFLEQSVSEYPFVYEDWQMEELRPFLRTDPMGPGLAALIAGISRSRVRTVDFLVALNRLVRSEIEYIIRMEPGVMSPEETLEKRHGSCRDSAWLLCQIFRHLGVASRFVSGYLIQLTPDIPALDGPAGPAADFTDLHAWCEAYLPGAGWVGLDPTSGLFAGEGHIPLAATPEPLSAAPITGSLDKCEVEFDFSMSVTRIQETPRVTKPYSDEQWRQVLSLGREVERDLQTQDVRLTQGGEPTFVSANDQQSAQWHTEALGAEKKHLAEVLLKRLKRKWGASGVPFYGQGKWYPGEPLPRWALAAFWRKDGVPVWHNQKLLADETRGYGLRVEDARDFLEALCDVLCIGTNFIKEGYEDIWYYLWKERRLPVNVDPLNNRLDSPEDRARLARVFEEGLANIVGYALPLAKNYGQIGWRTGQWFLRDERMYLLPGDSPMGLRLPLDSLPWVRIDDSDGLVQVDPMATGQTPFPGNPRQTAAKSGRESDSRGGWLVEQHLADGPPSPGESAHGVARTALCAQIRQDRLYVFLPPVATAADFLELVAAVEAAAEISQIPVLLEGYSPPFDSRLEVVKVTPDPGVIEVNVPPVERWDDLVEQTTCLYEEARSAHLTAEKFMLDGRLTGTGGGNHMVLGGLTPADSPFLRRPDLLRSLIGMWHNHPSLSYLFSSLFIGPTSQSPRVDEGRRDAIHELEIAFGQVPAGDNVQPWLVDRVFRHLLTDLTGNTHRSEICVDKLYSPDSSSGRLGLVEFRAFEMPPHARMSLVQQLLLRAMIAGFWRKPYTAELTRWDSDLHDRFLLPHFVRQDLEDTLAEIAELGWTLPLELFAPHLEFRFPRIGGVTYRGVEIELRSAIEPWYVLGEEPAGGGTSRFVDSSVERIQVKVRGLTPGRFLLACNGRRVPLHPTGTQTEFVAGVRFRAWQPASCLHPTLAPQLPLVFDLFDTWTGRSLGGCTYHVAHPGGRNFERFPVNANEAEGRRISRFMPIGHTPGPMATPPETARDVDLPFTLDLRRAALG